MIPLQFFLQAASAQHPQTQVGLRIRFSVCIQRTILIEQTRGFSCADWLVVCRKSDQRSSTKSWLVGRVTANNTGNKAARWLQLSLVQYVPPHAYQQPERISIGGIKIQRTRFKFWVRSRIYRAVTDQQRARVGVYLR